MTRNRWNLLGSVAVLLVLVISIGCCPNPTDTPCDEGGCCATELCARIRSEEDNGDQAGDQRQKTRPPPFFIEREKARDRVYCSGGGALAELFVNDEPGEPISTHPTHYDPHRRNTLEVGRSDESDEHETTVVGRHRGQSGHPRAYASAGEQVIVRRFLGAGRRVRSDRNKEGEEEQEARDYSHGCARQATTPRSDWMLTLSQWVDRIQS